MRLTPALAICLTVACVDSSTVDNSDDPPPTEAPADDAETEDDDNIVSASDSGSPPTSMSDSEPYVEPPPLPEECASETQSVLSFSVQPTVPGNSDHPDTVLVAAVEVAEPSAVVVACTHNEDSDKVFFAESEALETSHTLHLSGLIANSSYTCSAAPVCPFIAGGAATVNYQTSVPPTALKRLTPSINPALGMTGSWTLAPFSNGGTWIVIWDRDGRVRWWWPTPNSVGLDVEALADVGDDAIVWGGGYSSDGRVQVVDMIDGSVSYAFEPPGWEEDCFHHDAKRVEDDRLMTLEMVDNFPTSGGGSSWEGFRIRMVDQATDVVSFDFNSQTLVDDGTLEPGFGDVYHANWVDFRDTPTGGRVYASLCFSEQIVAIDEATHEALWLLGQGLGWTVLDANGSPLPDSALPQCQHGLEVDSTGDTLLVYDNGRNRVESRASEWHIDGTTKTATRLWNWTEPGWFESILGDIDWLDNDRVLVTQASLFSPEIVEVDRATGQVASRFTVASSAMYRAHRYNGCDFFSSVDECDATAERYDELRGLFSPATSEP